MTKDEMDVLDCVAGRGRYEPQGGGLTTFPYQRDGAALHQACVVLARQGFIVGENYGLWWFWTLPKETIQ